jgi:diguanylate cyclase (GGDEF)-like protein
VSTDSDPLTIGMLAQVIPEVEIVEIVVLPGHEIPGFVSGSSSDPGLVKASSRIRGRILGGLLGENLPGSFSCVIAGTRWRVAVESIRTERAEVVGALFVARPGRVWKVWERSLVKAFGAVLSHGAALAMREKSLLLQRRLDELVGQVAEKLMSASSTSRQEILTWTMRAISEALAVHAAVLRRHDYSKSVSVIEVQWPESPMLDHAPPKEVVFDAQVAMAAAKPPRWALAAELENRSDAITTAGGVKVREGDEPVARMCIPLLGAGPPWGTLTLVHFGRRSWAPEEVRMLQAVGALLMQLQARIDAEDQTLHNAVHDELTGLPNRRSLLAQLTHRLDDRQKTAILFFDLDRFKVMNDFLGHASGDWILSSVADRIRSTIGPDDFAARLGGDEFVVLFSGQHSEKEAIDFAEQILAALRRPVELAGQQITHAASVGVVLSTPGESNGMELIGWADIALYAAKRRGGNQAVLFDEGLRESVGKRSRTELTLRQAIDHGGLRLHYQPEIDLRSGRLLALEALVRWQHPALGLIPASAFMSVAEETGLVVDMGRWVFTEVCRQLAAWKVEYPDLAISVRVNVSPCQFLIGGLVKFVENCLDSYRVPGECLCIEIAERAILQEPEQTALIVEGFRALGIEVAIDDFGTNYASFAALKRLPVNYLKLSPDFVQGMGNDSIDSAIVETIVNLATALDLGVIAKGVESDETIDKLLDLSCVRGQGSFISVPMAAEKLGLMLRAGRVPIGTDRSRERRLAGSIAI